MNRIKPNRQYNNTETALRSFLREAVSIDNLFIQTVFAVALPRQKHPGAVAKRRPRAVVKRNSRHSASALGRKLHIRSFRFPLKIKASALILVRKKEGVERSFRHA